MTPCSAPRSRRWIAFFALLAPPLAGIADAQPQIDLPASPDEPKPAVAKPAAIDLPRETQIEVSLGQSANRTGTAIGGYGEIVLNAPDDQQPTTIDLRRFVLFVGHNFTERLRLYAELEIEHAVSSASDKGEVEVEQAFLDYLGWRPLNFRVGLLIIPVGIVNVYHEPTTFNGADRPDTDLYIIPSTWRELGAGIFGALGPLRYQAYAVTGFDARGFTADGLRGGHQEGQFARAHDWAVVGRLDWTPLAGLDFGLSGYRGNSGQGDQAIGSVPVTMVEADARMRWRGLEARGEFANVWITGTPLLNTQFDDGTVMGGPVSHQLRGGYLEVGYDLFHPLKQRLKYASALVAFARYERTDTQVDVRFHDRAFGHDREAITGGLTFRPIAEVVLKLDYQRRSVDIAAGERHGWNQVNAGVGFVF